MHAVFCAYFFITYVIAIYLKQKFLFKTNSFERYIKAN